MVVAAIAQLLLFELPTTEESLGVRQAFSQRLGLLSRRFSGIKTRSTKSQKRHERNFGVDSCDFVDAFVGR